MILRRAVLFCGSVFICGCLYSQIATGYLIYTDKVNSLNFKDYGLLTDKQPYKITSITIAPNTNYAILQIVASKQNEIDSISMSITQSKMIKLYEQDIVSVYHPELGCKIDEPTMKWFNVLPKDFYNKFSVEISSKEK